MPIHTILGKPGSGKSRWATGLLIKELVNGHRNIVTNLPLRVGRLNEYLQEHYPDVDCRLAQRLRIMTEDDMRFFYKFRSPEDPPQPVLEAVRPAEELADGMNAKDVRRILLDQEREADDRRDRDRALQCMKQSKLGAEGVAYFLDEAHIGFNARNWAATGVGALNYLSQHRKMSDVVFPITQSAGNLDKQFRSVTEDFTFLRNEYTAQWGIFKGRGRFVSKTFYEEPGKSSEPFKTETFEIDESGVGSCYDTAKGIGVSGTGADIGRRAKGINILWVIPAIVCLAALTYFIPVWMGKAASGYINRGAKADVLSAVAPVILAPVPRPPAVSDLPRPKERHEAESTLQADITVRGYVIRGRRLNVFLSDGRTLTEADESIKRIERNFVELKTGEKYWLVAPFAVPKSEGLGVRPDSAERVAVERHGDRKAVPAGVAAATVGEVATMPPDSKQLRTGDGRANLH